MRNFVCGPLRVESKTKKRMSKSYTLLQTLVLFREEVIKNLKITPTLRALLASPIIDVVVSFLDLFGRLKRLTVHNKIHERP